MIPTFRLHLERSPTRTVCGRKITIGIITTGATVPAADMERLCRACKRIWFGDPEADERRGALRRAARAERTP